jgi:glutaminyl-tRNA synthetase
MTERPKHFIAEIVDRDLERGLHRSVVTRFPPEPNGYLHIGHAKSILLNFGLARHYGGRCHLRFDDTNPTTEDMEYVEAIQRDVRWLGCDWGEHLYFASDYYERLYEKAVELIEAGKAYVDSLSLEEIRSYRGTVTEPGRPSPYRDRSVAENLDLFRRMRDGELEDGSHVLRAKIDLASPNMKMRDPLLYRIRRNAHHYRTGNAWSIYPLYDFTHCLSDSFEGITHSICTLEFENNRELYDWILDNVTVDARPHQYEFARLNLSYTMMSKRKLLELVQGQYVAGWDDPRMPTLAGMRRRGVTPKAIQALCELVGVARNNSMVDLGKLEFCIREDLNDQAPRVMCVLEPLEVVIESLPDQAVEMVEAPLFPPDVGREGSRPVPLSRRIFIEAADFSKSPPKGFHRLSPGAEVRLRYGPVIECVGVDEKDGEVVRLRCRHRSDADGRKVKGTIHWVSADHAVPVTVRLYDRLFSVERPESLDDLNPASLTEIGGALLEPAAAEMAEPGGHFQFERQGYFYVDPDATSERRIFNRTVTLRDTWQKREARRAETKGEAPPSASTERAPASQPTSKPERSVRSSGARSPEVERAAIALRDEHGIGDDDATRIARDATLSALFAQTVSAGAKPGLAANWLVNEVAPIARADLRFGGADLAALLALIDQGSISQTAAKEVLGAMAETGESPAAIVAARNLGHIGAGDLAETVAQVLADHPAEVARFRQGETKLTGFFVGQVMRASGGRADAQRVRAILAEKLAG